MLIFNYITTNLINGKQYVGMSTQDENYLGSGVYFRNAQRKHGKENFTREIICFCDTEQEAHENEAKYIKQYGTLAPNGYNISPTGGPHINGQHSEESKKKMSAAKKGRKLSEEHIQKLKKSHEGVNKGENNPMYGKTHSEEIKKKIAQTSRDREYSEDFKKRMSEMQKGDKGYWYGKKRSEEAKRKTSLALKRYHADKKELAHGISN